MILIYITCPSKEEAKKIGRHLLKKRLCACVNIIDRTTPIFWWPLGSSKLCEGSEAVLLVKTIKEKFKEIEKEVVKLHSYDVPCILSIKVDRVNKAYLDWLKGETK